MTRMNALALVPTSTAILVSNNHGAPLHDRIPLFINSVSLSKLDRARSLFPLSEGAPLIYIFPSAAAPNTGFCATSQRILSSESGYFDDRGRWSGLSVALRGLDWGLLWLLSAVVNSDGAGDADGW